MQRGVHVQVVPVTPMVKKLLIANIGIWVVLQLIIDKHFLSGGPVVTYLGLTPEWFLQDFFIWQAFTYMFLHSMSIWHIVFNMLMLWWFGSELETRWGPKFFLTYYLSCGLGAAIIYVLGTAVYAITTGAAGSYSGPPVVGASGAIFGLLLAYGILFGERTILFAFIFPMKVKYFVMIIGVIEVVSLLNSGGHSNVANLAHLGGLVSGYVFLLFWTRTQQKMRQQKKQRKGRGKLKLVVNNKEDGEKDPDQDPKYWN